MKTFLMYCLAVFVGIFTSAGVLKAQLDEGCLCVPEKQNGIKGFIAIDTCGYIRSDPNSNSGDCNALYNPSDINRLSEQGRTYAKQTWLIRFSVDALLLPAAEHDQ
ncbi:MAG TPA: hypothetical protein VEC36_02320 [Patescibacteria group bacterium]|nr:hypothetical protein [Patescibacteria group bacterium]